MVDADLCDIYALREANAKMDLGTTNSPAAPHSNFILKGRLRWVDSPVVNLIPPQRG
jgi:hypothetical protein